MPPVTIPGIQPWERSWGHPGSGAGAGPRTGHVPSLSLQWPHAAVPALGNKDAATFMSVPGATCSHCDVPSGGSPFPRARTGSCWRPAPSHHGVSPCPWCYLGPCHRGVTSGSRDVVSLPLAPWCLLSPVITLSPPCPPCPQPRRPRCHGNLPAAPPSVSMAAAAPPRAPPSGGKRVTAAPEVPGRRKRKRRQPWPCPSVP